MFQFEPSEASYGATPERPTSAELQAEIAHNAKLMRRTKDPKRRAALKAKQSALRRQVARARHHADARRQTAAKVGDQPIGPKLAKRIARVKARIAVEKAQIVKTKGSIAVAAGAAVASGVATLGVGAAVGAGAAAVLAGRLHKLELKLHRDRHLLKVLHLAASSGDPAAVKVAEQAAVAVESGHDPSAVVSGYPAPATPPPEPKTVERATQEAVAELADPSGATTEALLDAAGGTPSAAGEGASTDTEAAAVAEAAADTEAAAVVEAPDVGADDDDRPKKARRPIYKHPLLWILGLAAGGALALRGGK